MYEITLNGQTLYHPDSQDCNIISGLLHEKLNDAGFLEIGIAYNNPLYDSISERQGLIILYKNNNPIWYGEVRNISVDFNKNKTIYAVGEASYLNDTVQPQKQYNATKRQILVDMINHHNNMVGDKKKFKVGTVGNNATKTIKVVTDWEYTLDAIRNHICEDEEYFKIRHENGERYIDILPLEDYGKKSGQAIEFGENMLDYAEESSGEDIASVCIPLGVKLEESAIDGIDQYLTCEAANDNKNYVVLQKAVNSIGYITKVVHFNVLNTASALVTAALNYLQVAQYAKLSFKLSAVDLSILRNDIDNYNVGDYVQVICQSLGIDNDLWYPIRERDTDLLNIANNSIKIGAEGSKTITEKQADNVAELEKLMPKQDVILNAAKKNASALINGAGTNGHVVMHTNEKGVVYEILIMDTADIKTAKKIWRWNENGFGYSKDGGKTYGLAMTMDGSIVANYITSGEMTANRIRGGELIVGGSGTGANGKISVRGSKDFEMATLDKTGLNMAYGSINLGKDANNNSIFSVDAGGNLNATSATIRGKVTATSGFIGTEAAGWQIGNNNIHNGCLGVDSTAQGMYVGVDGFRNQYGQSYVQIKNGILITSSTLTAENLISRDQISGGSIYGYDFWAQEGNGADYRQYQGQSSPVFTVPGYRTNSEGEAVRTVLALQFKHGILTSFSYSDY